jgi:GNAT superfamily N-acetyltransferase
MTTPPLHGDAIRSEIEALTRWALSEMCDEVFKFERGVAVRTRDLPLVWTLNQVRIADDASADEVLELAERFQGDLPFRHVVVTGGHGAALAGQVDRLGEGWWAEREVLMAMTRQVDRHVDTGAVVELSELQMLALMREWLQEEHRRIGDDGLGQVSQYNRLEGALFNETCLGIVVDGAPASVAKVRFRDGISWVEDVYTTPSARGRGLAHAVVTEAVRRAWALGPRFTFIIADDEDWPKDFYARAGFAPLGCNHTFHRGDA